MSCHRPGNSASETSSVSSLYPAIAGWMFRYVQMIPAAVLLEHERHRTALLVELSVGQLDGIDVHVAFRQEEGPPIPVLVPRVLRRRGLLQFRPFAVSGAISWPSSTRAGTVSRPHLEPLRSLAIAHRMVRRRHHLVAIRLCSDGKRSREVPAGAGSNPTSRQENNEHQKTLHVSSPFHRKTPPRATRPDHQKCFRFAGVPYNFPDQTSYARS